MIDPRAPLNFSKLRVVDYLVGFGLPFLFFGFCGGAAIYPYDQNYLISALAGIATYCLVILAVFGLLMTDWF